MIKMILFAVFLLLIPLMGAVEKGPYLLYEGSNSSMTILWQMSSASQSTVSWGETTNYESGSGSGNPYGNDNQYRYTISGLKPGTLYHYSVSGVGEGTFRTAPESNAKRVKLFGYGDTRSNPNTHNSVCQGMVNRYESDSELHSAVIFSGDYVSQGGSESDWSEQFFPRKSGIMDLQADLPIVGAMGNHEGERTGGAAVLKKYFPFPHETSNNFYWSCDYGPVHVVFLDQYTTSLATGSAQHNWLKSDLASTDKEWIVVVFHSPGYSAGDGHENDKDIQNHIQPILEQYSVDLVITGDNHYYSRAEVNGVQHITTGGGGAPLYDPISSYPYIVKTDRSNHFCEFTFDDNNCEVVARRANGSVIETFTLSHEKNNTPSVSITSPSSDTTIAINYMITITAEVNSFDLPVSQVQFVSAGNVLGSDNSEPYSFDLSKTAPETIEIMAIATVDNQPCTSAVKTITIIDPAHQEFTITSVVASSSDDAEEYLSDGTIDLTSTDLEIVEEPKKGEQLVGIRFTGLDIPENAIISSATIQFTVDETGAGNDSYTILGEKSANSASFGSGAYNISQRATTDASVEWSPSDWNSVGASGNDQKTANLTSIVNEIRSTQGWNGTCTFIIRGSAQNSGSRVAESFDGSSTDAPVLEIVYRLGAENDAPIITSPMNDTAISTSETYSFMLEGSDSDNDELTWKLEINGYEEPNFDGTFEWYPSSTDTGENLFSVWLFDSQMASDSIMWTVSVEQETGVISLNQKTRNSGISLVPNPIHQGEEGRFIFDQSLLRNFSTAEITVVTSLGVPVFHSGAVPLSRHNGIIWNGTNFNGRTVASGTYLAMVSLRDGNGSRTVVTVPIGVKQ